MEHMEKVRKFLATVPDRIVEIINEQTLVTQCEDYFAKVEREIKYFKKHGTFKIPHSASESQQTTLTELNENIMQNPPRVKLERISESISNDVGCLKENIKIEKPDMPPPQNPVKKNRKLKKETSSSNLRSTRSKASKQNQESTGSVSSRDSDIVLENPVVETVTISDNDDENETNTTKTAKQKGTCTKTSKCDEDENNTSRRTTRTKKRTMKETSNEEHGKRTRSPLSDAESKNKSLPSIRQSKRKKPEGSPVIEESVYEDADSIASSKLETASLRSVNETYIAENQNAGNDEITNHVLNETHIITKSSSQGATQSNETIVVSEPKILKEPFVAPVNVQDIMTDDEDDNITVTLPKKVTKFTGKITKPIFSAFEGSPVKKRVEAFEKLGAEVESEIPVYTTRTKTKALKDRNEERAPVTPIHLRKTPQMANRYLASIANTTSKAMRTNVNESFISTKSASALKATQQDYMERQNWRREKETEAIKKREATLQAQIEEKRKKRLEKQMKAQQTREALEKTKIKGLEEVERLKEEKRKQILAGKQDKMKKQQEEAERRRLEVLKRAMEERKKEEERRKAAEEAQQQKTAFRNDEKKAKEYKKKAKDLPIYMRQEAPLLPTEDCYDSDEETNCKKIRKPTWYSRDSLKLQLNMKLGMKEVVSNFFQSNPTTPDLRDIFEYIDPRKLKRTSSAIWKVPPRYTLMPETIEEDGEE